MKFWDSSAIIPLIIDQDYSDELKECLKKDCHIVVWWGTIIECYSAISRLTREKVLDSAARNDALNLLKVLYKDWTEILPGNELRNQSMRAITVHGLKTLDSLQLSAALIWTNKNPVNNYFVSLDPKLRTAANKEGFNMIPEIVGC